ncbi:hypothetical protein [Pseudooceanicola atlanticus]|uniref:hypothetical protein n=1 Tax=Pseudooceanicola atlanticus TaxID=1461694 RepID=UPI00138E1D7F|nr:hypothetical protein [Pseudooceanicola atlanticus]
MDALAGMQGQGKIDCTTARPPVINEQLGKSRQASALLHLALTFGQNSVRPGPCLLELGLEGRFAAVIGKGGKIVEHVKDPGQPLHAAIGKGAFPTTVVPLTALAVSAPAIVSIASILPSMHRLDLSFASL